MAELGSFVIFDSDVLRAGLVSATLGGVALFGVMNAFLGNALKVKLRHPDLLGLLFLGLVVGIYGLMLALLGGNKTYYILADAYHWFAELILAILLMTWLLQKTTSEDLQTHTINWSIIASITGLFVVVLGTAGLLPYGGHVIGAISIWRLELGRGFPEYLLIPITAILFMSKPERNPRSWLAWGLLVLVLIFTFKRTLWGSYLLVVPFLFLSKRIIRIVLLSSVYLLTGAGFVIALFPGFVQRSVLALLELVNYNPNYTTEDSLLERVQQISSAAGYIQIKPWGYGLGAEFYTYWPGGNTWGVVHYIHNLYLFLLLQFGMPGFILIVLSVLWTFWIFFRQLEVSPEWDWCLRTGIAGLLAIIINGLTLLSIHSVFAALLLGMGYYGVIRSRDSDLVQAGTTPKMVTS